IIGNNKNTTNKQTIGESPNSKDNDVASKLAKLDNSMIESLQESEFEEFASNITNFNNGTQSADETVRNIGQIIKNRNLFIQMRTLIYKALAENTFSINSVSQSSIKVK
ncbi:hypothetical protein PIROE2DRAFT_3575, partial [Piromyces sp. E2]